jgi:peptidoglycan/xylan/chitin deacetylase (PgdA/CDA1 family)
MRTVVAVLLALAPAPPGVQIVSQGPSSSRAIALTFDAGADRGFAPRILRTLERAHIRATFGMTGKWASANRDLLRRMAHDRDAFINHTYDHRSFTGYSTNTAPLTLKQRTWEITQTARVVRAATGRGIKPYFRPPYGDYDQATLTLLRRLGYHYMVMWTLDSLGWEHLPSKAILQRCLADARPGTILLMHVGSQSQDAIALPNLIQDLKRRGYHFVTVPQMLHRH